MSCPSWLNKQLLGLSVKYTGILFIYLLLPAWLFSAGEPLYAATYYIAEDGSDSNDGLNPETAWQSLDKINSLGSSLADNSTLSVQKGEMYSGVRSDSPDRRKTQPWGRTAVAITR